MESGNAGRAERIAAQNQALLKLGRCTFCQPHQGENESRSRNVRYVDGKAVPRKGKDRK